MRLTCPCCGFFGAPDAFTSNAEEGRVALLAFSVPVTLAGRLQQYVRLHATPGRAVTTRRMEKLLAELVPSIREGNITRHGRAWPAPVAYWEAALDQVLFARDAGTLRLPLHGHGLLLEILSGIAGKAEGAAERKTEETRRYAYSTQRAFAGQGPGPLGQYMSIGGVPASPRPTGERGGGEGAATPARSVMPPETRQSIDRIKRQRSSDGQSA